MMRRVKTTKKNSETIDAVDALLEENCALRTDNIQLMREKNELLQRMLALHNANVELLEENVELLSSLSRGAKKPSSVRPNFFSPTKARTQTTQSKHSPQNPISPEKYKRLCSRK